MIGPEAGGGAGKALVAAGALAGVAGALAAWPVAGMRGGGGMKSGPFWPQAARLATPRTPMAASAKPQRPCK